MSLFLQWCVLAYALGPVRSVLAILLVRWALARWSAGALVDPLQLFRALFRTWRLKRDVAAKPHDVKAKTELAQLLRILRRNNAVIQLLRPVVESGNAEPEVLFQLALACLGAGYSAQGEALLSQVEGEDPRFRRGLVDLERGRWRLARKELAGARAALEAFLSNRPDSVEGRVLLARTLEQSGDAAAAKQMRHSAWRQYADTPSFYQRAERVWAWSARPSRPLTYVAMLLLMMAVPKVAEAGAHHAVRSFTRSTALLNLLARSNPEGPQVIDPADLPSGAPAGWNGWKAGELSFAAPAGFAPAPNADELPTQLVDGKGGVIAVQDQLTRERRCERAMATAREKGLSDFDVQAFAFAAAGEQGLRIEQRVSGARTYLVCVDQVLHVLAVSGVSSSDADALAQTVRLAIEEDDGPYDE